MWIQHILTVKFHLKLFYMMSFIVSFQFLTYPRFLLSRNRSNSCGHRWQMPINWKIQDTNHYTNIFLVAVFGIVTSLLVFVSFSCLDDYSELDYSRWYRWLVFPDVLDFFDVKTSIYNWGTNEHSWLAWKACSVPTCLSSKSSLFTKAQN